MNDVTLDILQHCDDVPTVHYRSGETLLEEGHWSGKLFILVEGDVEVSRGGTAVAVLGEPGAMFGEMSALLQMPHTATVRALTDVTVRVPEDAGSFLRDHPELAFHLARVLAQRLNAATTYLVDVKRQYDGRSDHLAMVGEVLEVLTVQQGRSFMPGPERTDDPRM